LFIKGRVVLQAIYLPSIILDGFLRSVHPEIPDGHSDVSRLEMWIFVQDQRNRGPAAKKWGLSTRSVAKKTRACAETYWSTSHKQDRNLTQRLGKKTISGWKLRSRHPIEERGPGFLQLPGKTGFRPQFIPNLFGAGITKKDNF
jgi:hypothetical protein